MIVAFSKSEIATAVVTTESASENAKMFNPNQELSKKDAVSRFKNARVEINYLLDNYDSVVGGGGGDNVRRYLGTVGTTSSLFGIRKVMKVLQEDANDIVEYTENMNEFDSFLRGADTNCYSANFVEFSSAKTKPEKFFIDAKADIKQMAVAMGKMADELNI